MNDRTHELWRECVLKHTKDPMNWQTVADEFAELLIQECVEQVELWEKDSRNHISYMLKQHFGVKQ